MSKETFKMFAKNNPSLVEVVLSKKATWQQLYELYEIYGESSSIWNNYIKTSNNNVVDNINTSATTIKNFLNTFKTIDMDSVQQGITNIQKTIGLLQDIGLSNNKERNNLYEAKPLYKKFDD